MLCPGPSVAAGGARGPFLGSASGPWKRMDRARSKQELKVGMLGLGLGRERDRDSRVPPRWPGSLTALCTGPFGAAWPVAAAGRGPAGLRLGSGRRRATLGAAPRRRRRVSSRPTTEEGCFEAEPRWEPSASRREGSERMLELGARGCVLYGGGRGWGAPERCALCSWGGERWGLKGCGACTPPLCPAKAADLSVFMYPA